MWTFGKKIAAGFVVSSLLLLAIGTASYRAAHSLVATSQQVTHSHQVLEHIANLISLLKDAETGMRGYVITGDEAFLEPYTAALPGLDTTAAELRKLTADNRTQQEQLDELLPRMMAKRSEFKSLIELRRSAGFDAVQKIVSTG